MEKEKLYEDIDIKLEDLEKLENGVLEDDFEEVDDEIKELFETEPKTKEEQPFRKRWD